LAKIDLANDGRIARGFEASCFRSSFGFGLHRTHVHTVSA
jgi:hypothetical protein